MKVLISGYYGFDNFGDEALLSGLAHSLTAQGHELTILSGDPQRTKELHKLKALHRYKGLIAALLNCDALISGGGGLLQDKTSFKSLQYYLWVIKLAKLLGKRVLIYGQSIGPLSSKGKDALKTALKNTRIAVRDKPSQALLENLGLSSTLVADAALLIPFAESSKQKSYTLLIPRYGHPDLTDALIELAKTLKAQNQDLVLSSVQANEDKTEITRIMQAVPDLRYVEASTPQDLLSIITQSNYVISARLHGLILAAVANKNYAGLIYDPKVKAFLNETGATAFETPIDHKALIKTVLERSPVNQDKLAAMRERARLGEAWLAEQLS